MTTLRLLKKIQIFFTLLRWDKPSGRLILLIPAGWSLWLTPSAPPQLDLVLLITAGGLFVSAAGCIANDLWDRKIDRLVIRTKNRPLAKGDIKISTAIYILLLMLLLSFLVVLSLPLPSRIICIKIAIISLIPILFYPSAKRWFKYPQLILALCWGFAAIIPWAASQSSLSFDPALINCWIATTSWTFGFDTVYAMADMDGDAELGLNSSALTLKNHSKQAVRISYLITSVAIAFAAISARVNFIFWPIWFLYSLGMQREILLLRQPKEVPMSVFGRHFSNQVRLGSLILFGLILGRMS